MSSDCPHQSPDPRHLGMIRCALAPELPLTPAVCDLCRLDWPDASPPTKPTPALRRLLSACAPNPSNNPCRHRGPATRRAGCPTCKGSVQLKIFACALHGECTPVTSLGDLPCCAGCNDYDSLDQHSAPPNPTAPAAR